MKKIKKSKEQKNVKAKWSVGKTVASVVGAISVISGVTVLGVYLAGGFEERVVNPESIAFNYGEELIFRNNQLEISGGDSFMLTINSPTAGVTAKKVSLSFKDADTRTSNGFISNEIIQVPETVTLGKPFEVKLLQTSYAYDTDGDGINDLFFDGIKGGISTLVAKSEYQQINRQELKVAVDTPVHAITSYLTDMSGVKLEKVGKNADFKVATKFYPTSSEYLYCDNLNDNITAKRTKLVLFGATNVETIYDNDFAVHFKTGDEIIEFSINAHSFKNAQTQLEQIDALQEGSASTQYTQLYGYLTGNNDEKVTAVNSFTMASASVGSFEIAKTGENIELVNGETSLIYVNQYEDFLYLGASILSTENEKLTYMLENIALEFVSFDGQTLDESEFSVESRESLIIDGKRLYLPFNSASDKNYCNWSVKPNFASTIKDVKVNVYLVMEEVGGTKALFKIDDNVQTKSFTIKTKEVEDEVPTFVGQDPTTFVVPQEFITLGIASDKIQQTSLNLREYISLPQANRYKSVKFFARFDSEQEMQDVLKGNVVGTHQFETGVDSPIWYILPSETITIYGAGTFDIRFMTVKPDGSMVKLCEATKTFVCQQELSNESVVLTETTLQTPTPVEDEGQNVAYIAQVDGENISVRFKLNPASINVFKQAFEAGRITLNVYSGSENLTDYFTIQNSGIMEAETESFITYELALKQGLGSFEEKEVTRFALSYDNGLTGETNRHIDWAVNVADVNDAPKIKIYSPLTNAIVVSDGTATEVKITQTLQNTGEFEISVIANEDNFDSIEAFLNANLTDAKIIIKDQHNRDTLAGKWELFYVSGDRNCVSVQGKAFEVKSNGEVVLGVKSLDGKDSGYRLTIKSEATGINHLTYQNNPATKGEGADSVTAQENTLSVVVSKYGTKDAEFTLSELVKYYLSEQGADEPVQYREISFRFSASYFRSLSDKQTIDLFGYNGMIAIYTDEEGRILIENLGSEVIEVKNGNLVVIKENASKDDFVDVLNSINITKLVIKENFGTEHPVKFSITDSNKVVNTDFTFRLLSALSVSEADYDEYAEVGFSITNKIDYSEEIDLEEGEEDNRPKTIGALYSDGKSYYVVSDGDKYKVSTTNAGSIATIEGGEIRFYDFFDEESKTYTITFDLANTFALSKTLTFTIHRNLEITSNNKTYYLLGGESNISDYVTFSRVKAAYSSVDSDEMSFSTNGNYLNLSGKTISQNGIVNFDYNEQVLTQKFQVKYDGTSLFEFDVKIALMKGVEELYKTLSNRLNSVNDGGIKGNLQSVNGVNYILFDSLLDGSQKDWTLNGTTITDTDVKNEAVISLGAYSSIYTLSSQTNLVFKSQSETLAGYNNKAFYLRIIFSESNGTNSVKFAEAHVPIIISKVGASPITYAPNAVEGVKTLETALTSFENLADYAEEVNAGQEGINLKSLSKLSDGQSVYVDFASNLNGVNTDVLKNISIDTIDEKKVVLMTLNHLSNEYDFVYLPLIWTVGDQQFHYLLKVSPDVIVKKVVYAYDGEEEHIASEVGKGTTIDFAEQFSSSTLHSGETRFSVVKVKGEETLSNLTEEYYVKSVQIGRNVYTSESAWSTYLNISIVGSKVTFTPQKDYQMTVVIGHRYPGDTNSLSVVGTDKTYTIVLNQSTKNYAVRFNGNDITQKYVWNLNNAELQKDNQIELVNGYKAKTLKIELLDQTNATASVEYGVLEVTATSGDVNTDGADGKAKYSYDNSSGDFTLSIPEYLSEDKVYEFTAYTQTGALATLTINVKSNVSVSLKENFENKELTGGSTIDLTDVFAVTYNGDKVTPTKYDVTLETEKTNHFAKWDGEKLTIADLFYNDNETLKITITLSDDKKFTFTQDVTLKANVTTIVPKSKEVIAKDALTLETSQFIEGNISVSKASITCENGDTYTVDVGGSSVTITPNYVGEEAQITVKLTITLTFDEETQAKQTKDVYYTFNVAPAVKITPNYPNPTGDTPLDVEYIKSGEKLANILTFLNGTADYAGGNRLNLESATLPKNASEVSYTTTDFSQNADDLADLTISITQCSNATIEFNTTTFTTGVVTNTNYNDSITFTRGNSATRSFITISVLYKGVSAYYNIELLDKVYTTSAVMETRNVAQGVSGGNSVNYETFYVDKANIEDIFANDRMLKASMQNFTAGYANQYKLVFVSDGKYYVSWAVNIIADDKASSLVYDLGASMQGNFVGAFLASDIDDNDYFTIEKNVLTAKNGATISLTDEALTIEVNDKALTNYKEALFAKAELTSRIETYYGGIKIATDKRNVSSGELDITNGIGEIKTIKVTVEKSAGGSAELTTTNFYYMNQIDVVVGKEASTSGNFISVNVNEEYDSIVDLFNIHHPSTNSLVKKSEFNSTISLKYEIVDDMTANEGEFKTTFPAYQNFKFVKTTTSDSKDYLRVAGKTNSTGAIYDYSILPLGAKNDGDYVLTKITYTSNNKDLKSFYVVVQILPDYRVTYKGSESGVDETVGNSMIKSNTESVVAISDLNNANYADFRLTSTQDASGFLSIKHKNGVNTQTELASTFKITLPLDDKDYNSTTNVEGKLALKGNTNWTGISDDKEIKIKYDNNGNTSFTGINKVVFGEQKYYIDCEDSYGYKVRLYFKLDMVDGESPHPYSTSTISMTEGDKVDLTARYELVNISKLENQVDKKTQLEFNSITEDPSSSNEESTVKLIELAGIDAYGFDADYTTAPVQYLKLKADESGYDLYIAKKAENQDIAKNQAESDYVLANENAEKYLKTPTIQYVTITSIEIVDAQGRSKSPEKLTKSTIATKASLLGYKNSYRNVEDAGIFQMPDLYPNAYGSGSTARVTMYITLKYENGTSQEVCTVPVNIELSRKVQFEENATTVVDGKFFALESAGYGETGIFKQAEDGVVNEYINDTLEVKVPTNSKVSFGLTLIPKLDPNSKTSVTYSISNIGYSYDKTYYLSLSSIFGQIVEKGDTIQTTNISNYGATFCYGNSQSSGDSGLSFQIRSITNDKILVDDQSQLARNYYTQEKYYILKGYRVTKTYYVTGKYYSMTKSTVNEIDDVLNTGDNAFTAWGTSLKFYNLSVTDAGKFKLTSVAADDKMYENLFFEIAQSESNANTGSVTIDASGKITITEAFTSDNYITVKIYQKVSGNEDSHHYLGTIRLGLKKS